MNIKNILVAGGVVLVIAIAVAFYLYHKPHTDYAKEDAAYQGSASDLYEKAIADHNAFLVTYRNKAVAVKGKIDHIESGSTLVLVPGILCHLVESNGTFVVGEEISLKGRVVGAEEDLISGEIHISLDKCTVLK